METKRRRLLWWTLGSLLVLVCLGLILAAYRFGWTETGFPSKTAWDWLQLLIIPLALALVALVVNQSNTRTERQISQQRYEQDQHIAQLRYEQDQQLALDKQREDLLQAYLDRMSELLLEKGLRTSLPDTEVRNVARVRTISILMQLDGRRVGYVFAFLREAGLIESPQPIVNFRHVQFTQVNWSHASLRNVNLSGADLSGASLSNADLSGANLSGTKLFGTNLSGTNLFGANLNEAMLFQVDLSEAKLFQADLSKTMFEDTNLSGAKLAKANLSGSLLIRIDLSGADLRGINLSKAELSKANLSGAKLEGADLSEVKLEEVLSLTDTDLRRVTGLTKEQLATCKANGAIIGEDSPTSASQPTVAPTSLPQSNDAQAPSAPPVQGSLPTSDANGSHASSSKPD